MPRLLSVNVGLPRDVTWNGKTVRTAVWKSPVTGRRMVRKLDIDGDAQADLAGHGGEQRAVFVYKAQKSQSSRIRACQENNYAQESLEAYIVLGCLGLGIEILANVYSSADGKENAYAKTEHDSGLRRPGSPGLWPGEPDGGAIA